jgi:hypothetical protein
MTSIVNCIRIQEKVVPWTDVKTQCNRDDDSLYFQATESNGHMYDVCVTSLAHELCLNI